MNSEDYEELWRKGEERRLSGKGDSSKTIGKVFLVTSILILILILYIGGKVRMSGGGYFGGILFTAVFAMIGILMMRGRNLLKASLEQIVILIFALIAAALFSFAMIQMAKGMSFSLVLPLLILGSAFGIFAVLLRAAVISHQPDVLDFLPVQELQQRAVQELRDPDSLYRIVFHDNLLAIRMKNPLDHEYNGVSIVHADILFEHMCVLNESDRTFHTYDFVLEQDSITGELRASAYNDEERIAPIVLRDGVEKEEVVFPYNDGRKLDDFCKEHGWTETI